MPVDHNERYEFGDIMRGWMVSCSLDSVHVTIPRGYWQKQRDVAEAIDGIAEAVRDGLRDVAMETRAE